LELLEDRLAPSNLVTLASFTGSNGLNPAGTLVEDSSGNLFGTTPYGGAFGFGTVFELAKGSGTITTLASFNGSNGNGPIGRLKEDSSGNLFGAASLGGPFNDGTVFELAKGSGTITDLAVFNGSNGTGPDCSLVEDGTGNLFGVTGKGGQFNYGTVFELAKGSGTITTLASFNGSSNGDAPVGQLVEDSSGNLFGTTKLGGLSNGALGDGTLFEVAKGSGTITTLTAFNRTNGQFPEAGLVADSSGNLFGTTSFGGPSDDGTVFELAKGSATIATLASFNGSNGIIPDCSLVVDGDGNLFGTTSGVFAGLADTVFEIAKGSGTITTLASINDATGDVITQVGDLSGSAGLVEDSSGNFFGTTVNGGTSNDGTVFEVQNQAVQPPSVTPPSSQPAVEGTSQSIALGSFSDTGSGPWNVDVKWGDGSPDTTFSATAPGSLAMQSHLFSEEGSYTVKVTVSDSGDGASGSASFQVAVSDPAVLGTAVKVNAIAGSAFSGPVTTITDPGAAEANDGMHYTASIDWGDKTTPTTGMISVSNGTFTASGSHIYATGGSFTISCTINHETVLTTVMSSATVSPAMQPPPVVTAAANQSAVEGSAQSFGVGSFSDAGAGPWNVDVKW
jgi:uncharacterized repeat protein (TIGR03803 family)